MYICSYYIKSDPIKEMRLVPSIYESASKNWALKCETISYSMKRCIFKFLNCN